MNIFAQLTEAQRNQQRRRMADAGGNIRAGGIGLANPVGLSNAYNNASLMNQLRLNTPTPRMITPPSPPPPSSPFGTQLKNVFGRVGDFVKDDRRFGDFAAGAQILSGTPLADAFAVRDTINPIADSFTVGTLYDVFDNTTGTVIGQVSSKDKAEYERILANPNLSIRELSPAVETGRTPEGTVKRVDDDGNVSYEYIRGYNETETLDEIRRTNTHVRVVAQQTRKLEDAYKNVIRYTKKQTDGVKRVFVLSGGLDAAGQVEESLRAAFTSDEGSLARGSFQFIKSANFINAIAAMRASNKTGGGVGSVTENEMKVLSASAELLTPASSDFINQLQGALEEIGTQRNKVNAEAEIDIRLLRKRLSGATENELYPLQENQEV